MYGTFSLNNFFSRFVRVSPLAIIGITLTLDERACRACTSCAFKLNVMGESLVNTALPTNQKLQYSVLRMARRCYKVQTCMYSGINFMTSNSDYFFCVPIFLILLIYVSDNRFNAAIKLKGSWVSVVNSYLRGQSFLTLQSDLYDHQIQEYQLHIIEAWYHFPRVHMWVEWFGRSWPGPLEWCRWWDRCWTRYS